MLSSYVSVFVSISRNKNFTWVLPCKTRPSRPPAKDSTGDEDQRCKVKTVHLHFWGNAYRYRDMFSVQVVVFVSLKVSLRTQIDSKSNMAKILSKFVHTYKKYQKTPAGQKKFFFEFDNCSWDRHFSRVHCMWLNVAPNRIFSGASSIIRTAKRLENCINVAHMTHLVVVFQ